MFKKSKPSERFIKVSKDFMIEDERVLFVTRVKIQKDKMFPSPSSRNFIAVFLLTVIVLCFIGSKISIISSSKNFSPISANKKSFVIISITKGVVLFVFSSSTQPSLQILAKVLHSPPIKYPGFASLLNIILIKVLYMCCFSSIVSLTHSPEIVFDIDKETR